MTIKDINKWTPIESASNDHVRELIIIYSNPRHDPTKDDMQGLSLEGDKLKIEWILIEKFGK